MLTEHLQLIGVPSQIGPHAHAEQRHPAAVENRILIPVMQRREQAAQDLSRFVAWIKRSGIRGTGSCSNPGFRFAPSRLRC